MKKLLLISALFIPLLFVCSFSQYGKWTELHPPRTHNEDFFFDYYRTGFGLTEIIDGKILLFGGNGGKHINDDTWIFDLEQNTWIKVETSHTPLPRAEHQLAQIIPGKVLLFGGQNSSLDTILDDTWIFDIDKMDWEKIEIELHPTGRYTYGMSKLSEGKVVMFGGDLLQPGGFYSYGSETWIYDYYKNEWIYCGKLTENPPGQWPKNRGGTSLAQISEGKVLMFGGWLFQTLEDTWIFDESNKKWQQIFPDSLPESLSGMTLTPLSNNYILLFGGIDNWGYVTNDSWLFCIKDTNWIKVDNSFFPGKRSFHNLSKITNGKAILTGYQEYNDTWLFELDSSFIDVKENASKLPEIKTFINSKNELILDYYLTESGKSEIEIFNINGIRVFRTENIQTQSGWYREIIPVDNLTIGVYFVRVREGSLNLVGKFLIY